MKGQLLERAPELQGAGSEPGESTALTEDAVKAEHLDDFVDLTAEHKVATEHKSMEVGNGADHHKERPVQETADSSVEITLQRWICAKCKYDKNVLVEGADFMFCDQCGQHRNVSLQRPWSERVSQSRLKGWLVQEYTFDGNGTMRVVDTKRPATFRPPITKPDSDAAYDIPIGWGNVNDIKKRVRCVKAVGKGKTQKDGGQGPIYVSYQVTYDADTQTEGTAEPDSEGGANHLNGNYLSIYLTRESAKGLVTELAFLPSGVGMRPPTKGSAGQFFCPMQLFMSVSHTW
jgi:hypothetical protein